MKKQYRLKRINNHNDPNNKYFYKCNGFKQNDLFSLNPKKRINIIYNVMCEGIKKIRHE